MGERQDRLTAEQYDVMKENVNRIMGLAKDMLETVGEVSPLFIVMEKDGVRGMDISPYFDDKDLVADMMRAVQMDPKTQATMFASEAWLAKVDKDSEEGKRIAAGEDPSLRPSERTDKMEVVIVLCESRNGAFSAYAEIDRSGKTPTLGKTEFMPESETTTMRGRFVGGFET